MKTNNYYIKTDRPEISDQDILQKKMPFENVVQNFNTIVKPLKPIYKSPYFMGGVSGLIVTAVTLSIVFLKPDNKDLLKTASATAATVSPFVNPPLPENNIAFETYTIFEDSSCDITTENGTKLHIPKGAFLDSLGNSVPFPIEIKYRDFKNPIDFFLAGIPMQYDSGGIPYTFESAGMLELRALKDKNELKLADGKKINVQMPTNNTDKDFNLYYLDENKKKWEYLGKDVVTENKELPNQQVNTAKKEIAREQAVDKNARIGLSENIVIPVKAQKNKYIFKVNGSAYKNFSELNKYQNVMFQVSENEKKFNIKYYSVKWNKMELQRTQLKNEYLLTLSRGDTAVKILANPVFDENGMENAKKIYLQMEEQKTANKKNTKFSTQYSSSANTSNTASRINSNVNSTANRILNTITANADFRSFDLTYGMGVYNCDRPLPPVNNFYMKPMFSENNKKVNYTALYVVDLSKNAIFYFLHNEKQGIGEMVNCNKRSHNLIWVLTPDNKIGIVLPATFFTAVNGTQTISGTIPGTKRNVEYQDHKYNVALLDASDGIRELQDYLKTNAKF